MPQEKMMTFEEVNDHVEKHSVAAQKGAAAAAPAANVCAIYKTARPILIWLSQLPLPGKWKEIIKAFIGGMDAFCPQ